MAEGCTRVPGGRPGQEGPSPAHRLQGGPRGLPVPVGSGGFLGGSGCRAPTPPRGRAWGGGREARVQAPASAARIPAPDTRRRCCRQNAAAAGGGPARGARPQAAGRAGGRVLEARLAARLRRRKKMRSALCFPREPIFLPSSRGPAFTVPERCYLSREGSRGPRGLRVLLSQGYSGLKSHFAGIPAPPPRCSPSFVRAARGGGASGLRPLSTVPASREARAHLCACVYTCVLLTHGAQGTRVCVHALCPRFRAHPGTGSQVWGLPRAPPRPAAGPDPSPAGDPPQQAERPFVSKAHSVFSDFSKSHTKSRPPQPANTGNCPQARPGRAGPQARPEAWGMRSLLWLPAAAGARPLR